MWAGGAKDAPPRTDKWIRITQSSMIMKRTVKIVLTAFVRWIGKLYLSLRTWVHVLCLQDALVCKLVKDLLRIDSLPYRIGFAQKRVTMRRFHGCKGALFPKYPDSWVELSGKWLAAYRDTKPTSEVCYKTTSKTEITKVF
jgi:hypothetical protein